MVVVVVALFVVLLFLMIGAVAMRWRNKARDSKTRDLEEGGLSPHAECAECAECAEPPMMLSGAGTFPGKMKPGTARLVAVRRRVCWPRARVCGGACAHAVADTRVRRW